MRKLTLLIALLIAAATTTQAQVTRGTNGNFTAKQTAAHDSVTTYTYTDSKGKIEPVFVGKRGAYYVPRTSKPSKRNNFTPRYYRKYLKD